MPERADAARNRAAVLNAAEALFRRHDISRVTLARIASEAGVGKATVLRRFGDLNGLVEAVLEPRVAALRESLRTGAPPLGPGGTPEQALHSFIDALLDFVLDNRPLIRALEHRRPNAYYANPASQYWISELSHRLHTFRPDADARYLAYIICTAVRADIIDYLSTEEKMDSKRIRAGIHALAADAN